MCITSSDFETVLNKFLEDNPLSIYKIAFSNIKNTNVGANIKYYPSFIIYNKGKVVDYLEANKDEDIDFYTSKEGFTKWFTKYININTNKTSNNNQQNINLNESLNNNKDYNIILDNIIKEPGKVNIYFFWGNGCPHCEDEQKFFDSIKEEYHDKFNLYKYEVWYNKNNAKILEAFATTMGGKVSGVPYTIIGKESFSGFGSSSKSKFINTIKKQSKNNFDVYFDKIKDNKPS